MLKQFFGFFRKKPSCAEQKDRIVKKIVRNGAKDFITGDDSLSIDGKHRLIKEQINKKARLILKQAINNPEVMLDYINSKGTAIVKSGFMHIILPLFGETEGFVLPMRGLKAFLFTLIIKKLKPGFKTPAMFALRDEPVNIYTMSHQFHLWLSYINKLPGFEEKTMKNFKNFWKQGEDSEDISYLPVEEMYALKDILAREAEALNFVTEMGREFEGQKKSLKKLQDGKSVNL